MPSLILGKKTACVEFKSGYGFAIHNFLVIHLQHFPKEITDCYTAVKFLPAKNVIVITVYTSKINDGTANNMSSDLMETQTYKAGCQV